MHRLYENEDITIFWDSDKCIHAKVCVHQCPGVFNKDNRPWINIEGAPTPQIWQTVSKCPSGALSCIYNHSVKIIFDESRQCSLALDGDTEIVECCYEAGPDSWTIVHTGVRSEYEGKGFAKRLVYKITEEAEKRKLTVIPACSYASGVLRGK